MGHELALKFLLVDIKVLNHPIIIRYILYLNTVALKNMYQMCPLLQYRLNNQFIFPQGPGC